MSARSKRWIVYLAVCLIVAGLCILVEWIDRIGGFGFNRETWLANAETYINNPRLNMVPDLLRNHLKRGQSTDEVVKLLGEPKNRTDDLIPFTDNEIFSTADATKTSIVYTYLVGVPWIDPADLCLAFDKSGKLFKAWQFGY